MKAIITKTVEPNTDGLDMSLKRVMIGLKVTIRIFGLPVYRKTVISPSACGLTEFEWMYP